MELEFEWDEEKARANLAKHRVSFLTAAEIFADEIMERIDDREDYGEVRFIALGRVNTEVYRVVFTWRGGDFAPDESTEVEVRFDPDPRGTRVSVQHRGWDALADAHRARHGLGKSGAFTSMVGLWWADLFTELRASHRSATRGA